MGQVISTQRVTRCAENNRSDCSENHQQAVVFVDCVYCVVCANAILGSRLEMKMGTFQKPFVTNAERDTQNSILCLVRVNVADC